MQREASSRAREWKCARRRGAKGGTFLDVFARLCAGFEEDQAVFFGKGLGFSERHLTG
eukprot:EC838005.1.p6 GENE.EC838005.1~~EC838005.1.p6  ORF type:complete len:58 (+),score=4.84 EC838005.1:363-536(+)